MQIFSQFSCPEHVDKMSGLTNSRLKNLNLKLHLITETVISLCFLLEMHCRIIMSLCLQEYTIPKMTTPCETSEI